MPLTQFAVTNAAAKDKPYKLTDGDGLHLLVRPNGSKLWRMRYRFNGQENMLAFGMFPAITIAKARAKRDEARALLASGMNPSVKRKLDKIASVTAARNTFGDVAADHLAHMEANGTAATTMKKNRWMLQKLCTPIAKRPIADISAAEILDLLKKVEKSGRRETATSLRGKDRQRFPLRRRDIARRHGPNFCTQRCTTQTKGAAPRGHYRGEASRRFDAVN
jgi:hypothetical protein